VLKRAYFMTVIHGVFCLSGTCAFQPLRPTWVRLWSITTLQ